MHCVNYGVATDGMCESERVTVRRQAYSRRCSTSGVTKKPGTVTPLTTTSLRCPSGKLSHSPRAVHTSLMPRRF
jgi:hypothetical protein